MRGVVWVLVALVAALAGTVAVLAGRLVRARRQARTFASVLAEVAAGNGNRRMLARAGDELAPAIFAANEVVTGYERRLTALARQEASSRQALASLSHDVRTPLTTLIGYLDALERRHAAELDAEGSAYLATAASKARDLKRYTDELFDFCRLEAGEFPPEPVEFDLAEEVRRVLASWIVRFEEAGVELVADIAPGPCPAMADPRALGRIVANLIANALEHARARRVTVAVAPEDAPPAPGRVMLRVADDGVGIPSRDRAHVFDRLYTGDPSRHAGSGLGLPIARELARGMGGDVTVESIPGHGAVFSVALPRLERLEGVGASTFQKR